VPGEAACSRPMEPRSAWARALLHVWLAAPARPNSAATRATTMSLAGLVRMHDPHAFRARRFAVEGCAIKGCGPHLRISLRPNAERPNVAERGLSCTGRTSRRRPPRRHRKNSRPVEDSAILGSWAKSAATSIHRITSNVQARSPRTATGVRLWQDAPSALGGSAVASRVPLTASESARTVLYKHHAGPGLWLNHS
jgi:hypothetical protein